MVLPGVSGAGPDLDVLVLVIVAVGFALSMFAAGMYLVFSIHDELTGTLLIGLGIIVMLLVLAVYIAYAVGLKAPGSRAVSRACGSQSG